MITSTQAKKIATIAALDALIGRAAAPPDGSTAEIKRDLGQLASIVRQLVARNGPKVQVA